MADPLEAAAQVLTAEAIAKGPYDGWRRETTQAIVTAYLDSLLGELPEESDCGVCGLPGEYQIVVCEGYSVPRCHAHRLTSPYQAESRLAALRDSLVSGREGTGDE